MACDPNTLLQNGRAFQTLDQRSQDIVIAQLLCDIASSGGVSGGGIRFGDPTAGPTIPGAMAYDSLGNVWVDLDPAGAHDWQILIAGPTGMQNRAAPMQVAKMEVPSGPEMPQVSVAQRVRKAWQYMSVWVLFFIP